jgi:hypothetical protein
MQPMKQAPAQNWTLCLVPYRNVLEMVALQEQWLQHRYHTYL